MLDVIGALALGAVLVVDVTVLIGLAAISTRAKFSAFVIAGTWVTTIVMLAAMGRFAPGALGPIAAPTLVFGVTLTGLLAAWLRSPAFRNALLSVPLTGLVGINAMRAGGIFFLVLYAQGRLSAPFAPSAGWGDIVTGLAAIGLAAMVARGSQRPDVRLATWNAFGALDLIVAVTLGLLSEPGTPLRVFTDAPGIAAMTTLPWVAVPTLLVPLYLLTHLTIAARLWSARTARTIALAT